MSENVKSEFYTLFLCTYAKAACACPYTMEIILVKSVHIRILLVSFRIRNHPSELSVINSCGLLNVVCILNFKSRGSKLTPYSRAFWACTQDICDCMAVYTKSWWIFAGHRITSSLAMWSHNHNHQAPLDPSYKCKCYAYRIDHTLYMYVSLF